MVNDERGGRALIKLDASVNYRGSSWRYVVVSPRHKGNEIAWLQTGKKLLAAVTGIADEQAESSDALNTSTWRGGLAFTGEVEPLS